MSVQEFLKKELQQLSNQFGITFNYRFDSYSDMHIVSVSPSELYDDRSYAEKEFHVTREFDKKFCPECVLFVANNDILVSVDLQEFTICPENLFKLPIIEGIKWDFNDDDHLHYGYALAA
jgi:hypothetical protein